MSKRGMRAAGVCLATVAVMSGSVVANGAVAPPDSTQKLAAEDFSVRFSATPTRVVLGPDGGKTAAKYRIVVTHPRSIDQIDNVYLDFERGDGLRFNHFSMRGVVVREPSATRTVLSGGTGFKSSYFRLPRYRYHRAFPGFYQSVHVSVFVDGDPVSNIRAKPPKGRVHLLYATRTVLAEPSLTRGDVVLRGRVLGYNGKLSAHPKKQWSAAADKRVRVLFLRRGATQPRVVTTAKTDSNGRYSVTHEVHRPGRWWARFPGNRHLDASRSVGYQVSVS